MNYTEIEMEGMKEILRDKEEEIKKLKSDLSLVIKERDDNIEQNKKLKEENSYWKKIVDITPQDEKSVAEETIQDLLKEIKRLEEELESVKEDNMILNNNRNSSVEYSRELEEEIKNLNRRIKELEQCNLNLQTWIDNKEKVNKSLREELQRYKDMGDSGEF